MIVQEAYRCLTTRYDVNVVRIFAATKTGIDTRYVCTADTYTY